MNRNMIALDEVPIHKFNHHAGEQPRKLMSRKNKKGKSFLELENEANQINKHRQHYKRASAKYAARSPWHLNDILN